MKTREFGARLRELREQAGLSQRELADKVGINFTYLSKIESGVMPPPSEKVILRLVEVLNADRDELMTLAGKVPSDIAEMLKNRETLQFLRSGRMQKKARAANKKEGFNSFNIRLRELREQASLSQRELADKVGINFTYLSKIESGVMPPPSEKVILRLAEVLNADRDELMTLAGRVPSDIAQILKNRETLQLLRSGRTQKKSRVANKDEVSIMSIMKYLINYKRLSRVAIPVALVCAMAASLWFASPSLVKALDIAITDPEGQTTLPTGTIGSIYSLKVKVTVGANELVPIESIDLNIYNSANAATYNATCTNLPLINGGIKYYSDEDTGGGGTVNITATAPEWDWLFGRGAATWQSDDYTFFPATGGYGYGFAGPASITYSIVWRSPSDWPEGDYKIDAKITADGIIFPQQSSQFMLYKGLIAETSISQVLDASTVAVVKVNINRIKDFSTGLTAEIPGGIGSYEAVVSSTPASGINFLTVNSGVPPFGTPIFSNVTGVFSLATVSPPSQPNNTTVAQVVPRLVGNCLTTYNITVAFNTIGAAGETGLNVPEEHANSIILLRGDAKVGGAPGVDIFDAMYIAQYTVFGRTLNELNPLNAASVKYDGAGGDKIDIFDAMFIAQYTVFGRDAYFNEK